MLCEKNLDTFLTKKDISAIFYAINMDIEQRCSVIRTRNAYVLWASEIPGLEHLNHNFFVGFGTIRQRILKDLYSHPPRKLLIILYNIDLKESV